MSKEPIRLTLNGRAVEAYGDPDTPFLSVLRHELGILTARFGCGEGLCGACTVVIDGRAVCSCDVPLSDVEGARVETVEGLAASDPPHPLIGAFIARQAAQCGYCIPGILMTAKALLDTNPTPTRAEIATALDGNLCRCGTHVRILDAVEAAARGPGAAEARPEPTR